MEKDPSIFDFCHVPEHTDSLMKAAGIVVRDVLALKENETFLIIGNPVSDSFAVSLALYNAAIQAGAVPSLIFQPVKTQFDYAEDSVIFALRAAPAVCASISAVKLGKDIYAMETPYVGDGGKVFTNTFDYQMHGRKCMRSFWSPGVTVDMFCRTAAIDYAALRRDCLHLKECMKDGCSVHITSPGGTDVTIGIQGRTPFSDDGDFTEAGRGGNVPAGEVFISPAVASAQGVIVFDGTVSLSDHDVLPDKPVTVHFEHGYISSISGGETAAQLNACIEAAAEKAVQMEKDGKLLAGNGASYAKNARHLGELGIGLNPRATVCANMLEAEKAFHTCHFAIGSNYDDDAESLIHLDCLVRNPDIMIVYPDASTRCIVKAGIVQY